MINYQESKNVFMSTLIIFVAIGTMFIPTKVLARNIDVNSLTKHNYNNIINLDIKYIKSNNSMSKLISEILAIDRLREEELNNFINNKLGVKVYDEESSLKIHYFQICKYNRWQRINELKDSKNKLEEPIYITNKYFTDIYHPTYSIIDTSTDEESNKIQSQLIELLNSIPLKKELVENVSIFISPFKLSGITGFYIGGINENISNSSIVLANYYAKDEFHEFDVNSNRYENIIKDTILHELGHSIERSVDCNNVFNTDTPLAEIYEVYYPINNITSYNSDLGDWCISQCENIAEDFRIFYSDKLADNSYTPIDKRTSWNYNIEIEELFKEFIPVS